VKSVQSRFSTLVTGTLSPSYEATSKQEPLSDASNTIFLSSAPLAPRASPGSNPETCVLPLPCAPGPTTLVNPPFSLNTRLLLCFHGEIITYDLKALDSDTRPVIELLKITDSERGNWMTVGAYYRRSGHIRAAMSVIQTMIEGNWALRHVTKSLI
jgi:hypothetical protein